MSMKYCCIFGSSCISQDILYLWEKQNPLNNFYTHIQHKLCTIFELPRIYGQIMQKLRHKSLILTVKLKFYTIFWVSRTRSTIFPHIQHKICTILELQAISSIN